MLRKNSISSLNFVNSISGGDPIYEDTIYYCGETYETNCETCGLETSIVPTDCITNDATRSLRPTAGLECYGLNTGELC